MQPNDPPLRVATHDPRRNLVRWLAAMGCLWYPVDLDPQLYATLDPTALLLASCVVGSETLLLQHDLDHRPDHVRVVCELGPLPRGDPNPKLLDLLQANLLMALRGRCAAFGMEVDADTVCLTDELPLHDDDEAGFAVQLHHLATLAQRWRQGGLFPGWR